MKPVMRALVMAMLIGSATAVCLGGEADTVRLLKAQNKLLRAQIQRLRKEIAELKDEIKRGKEGTTTTRPGPTTRKGPEPKYKYLGRRVSRQWFDRMLKQFADKIVLHDGNFRDVGKAIARRPVIWIKPPETGAVRWPFAGVVLRSATVLQVLGRGECLVVIRATQFAGNRPERTTITVHVVGAGADLVDDVAFPDVALVYVGPYSYADTSGARRTVQSYRVHRTLTPSEFAEAIAGGFRLMKYRKVKKRRRVGHTTGGFQPRTVWRIEEYYEIHSSPVP